MSTVRASCGTQLLAEANALETIPRGIGRRQESEECIWAAQQFLSSVKLIGDQERIGNTQGRWLMFEGQWPFVASGQRRL